MLKIGITGGIGTGKSMVCRIFELLQIPVYDSDLRAKHVMAHNAVLKQELIQAFGPETLNEQGLEFIVNDTDKAQIKVYPANLPGQTNQFMLPPEQRARLVYVDSMAEADYFLTEYRWHPQDYPLKEEVLQIKVDDIKIFSVFRIDTVYHMSNAELFPY